MALTAKELLERDAKRNIGEELLAAIRDVKAGRHGDVHHVQVTEAAEARRKTGLSQPKFAELLGVSVKTLQDWKQGRRVPSGAARSLLHAARCTLHVAALRPDVFRDVLLVQA
ncbi:helix-turn-helix domain-containing protein [Pseudomonas syringae]|uniref:helix-turn-helix domain-containing protein n=1 Tax=Pseudomonas syringae TaxID=317 RepID=UPI003F75267D